MLVTFPWEMKGKKKKEKKTMYTSISMFSGFQCCAIFKTFLCIMVHPEAEEGHSLKIECSWPCGGYWLSLHGVSQCFLYHVLHKVTKAAPCIHSWWTTQNKKVEILSKSDDDEDVVIVDLGKYMKVATIL